MLAVRSYGRWHAQCITEDYTDVDYQSLCAGLGFGRAVGVRRTAAAHVDFENFAVVQLNHGADVTLRSAAKSIVRRTDRPCEAVYVVCGGGGGATAP